MRWLILLLIWFVIFLARFFNSYQAIGELGHLADEKISVIGRISSEPILQGSSQRFKIGWIEVVVKAYPQYQYGQKLAVSGILQRRVTNRWYSRFSLMYPDVEIFKADNSFPIGLWLRRRIIYIRDQIEIVFNRNLSEPEASLLAGIVLGVKKGLSQSFYADLQQTGTMHIVVASGFNITIVLGTTVAYLAGLLKRQKAIILGISLAVVYTLMAGCQPAIVRAAIMGSLGFIGQALGRRAESKRLLILAGLVMLVVDPLLIFDLGFQLSFSATAGLLWLGPLMNRIFGRIWLIGKDLGETASAQIAVAPIIFVVFGQMNPFSILVNGLILWLVPLIMSLGAVLALTRLRLVAWLVYVPLTLMVRIIRIFSQW